MRVRRLIKRAFTPITIMLIPHSNTRPFRLKVPSIGIFISVLLMIMGTAFVVNIVDEAFKYETVNEKLGYYTDQFTRLKSTVLTLKKAESEFTRLFSLGNKEEILEGLDASDSGSMDSRDMEILKQQIKITMESVAEIKDYLSEQRNIYFATPRGWPTTGRITSSYGYREHPMTSKRDFHTGVDIADKPGTPVKVTANGIVSFAGWSGANGKLIVIEHGFGYSTFYGHNKKLKVKVGQKIKRGEVIAYVGSTGSSTGPHVHYEVWKDGKIMNPKKYLEGKG
jgi:murein DD-endopeptidase MepM/ murein hydrolase activator NlpD